jgi:hypothetical protein
MKPSNAKTSSLRLSAGLVALLALASPLGFSGAALAQEAKPAPKAAGGDDNPSYKGKTVYDFDDDAVEGDLQRPDGELIDSVRKVKHSSLIEIRKDFIPEMLKSLEDV